MITIQSKGLNASRIEPFVSKHKDEYNPRTSEPYDTRGIVYHDDENLLALADEERERVHKAETRLRSLNQRRRIG